MKTYTQMDAPDERSDDSGEAVFSETEEEFGDEQLEGADPLPPVEDDEELIDVNLLISNDLKSNFELVS